MGKIRIYELAKELGLDNRVIIAKAQEIGLEGKKSHSNSLTDEEADSLRRALIREAIGSESAESEETVKVSIDSANGTTERVVERRKGGVVRRRRKAIDEAAAEAAPAAGSADVVVRRAKSDSSGGSMLSEGNAAVSREVDFAEQASRSEEQPNSQSALQAADDLFKAAPAKAEATEAPVEPVVEDTPTPVEEPVAETAPAVDAQPVVEAQATEEPAAPVEEVVASEPVAAQEEVAATEEAADTAEVVVEEVESKPEQPLAAAVEVEAPAAAPVQPQVDSKGLPLIGSAGNGEAEVGGPKVLGRIELPTRPKRGRGRTAEAPAASATAAASSPSSGGRDGGRRKKGRRREFSRGDLVDYEGRSGKRGKRGKGRNRYEDDYDNSTAAVNTVEMKASKRVIKMTSDVITVGELAHQMSLKAADVIKKLFEMGMMATINQPIDQDTATIIADEFNYTIEFTGFQEDDLLAVEEIEDEGALEPRSPVVTVMGHVDHGKTSLLDYIRSASVADREHGGITQHIGAYKVGLEDGKEIAFIDTPGHAAFTAMRARGADVTDIVVLVVAADDGVMPQTIEAINHAKAAEVALVVAINKMDKVDANPDVVKAKLAEFGLQPEEWGGDTLMFPVSAHTGQGIPELLEGIQLVAELKELKANPECRAKGTILEARQEVGRGTVATVLVQHGTLEVGDIFVCGAESGRVRSMLDFRGKKVMKAGPSTPVEITGLNGVPAAGDDFVQVENDGDAKAVASARAELIKRKEALALSGGPISLEEFSKRATTEEASELNLIVKADVDGSLEAVKESVHKLATDKVKVKVVHGAVGGVNESDVQLAVASKALIVGFNVRGEPRALSEAENNGVEIRFYRVIYELLDDVKDAMAGLLAPIQEEVHLARAEVRDTFSVPKVGVVAGCYVQDGTVKRGAKLRLLRDSVVIHEGQMLALRRFKDDVKEVQSGYECGISFAGFNDIKHGDVIEVFEIHERAATLD